MAIVSPRARLPGSSVLLPSSSSSSFVNDACGGVVAPMPSNNADYRPVSAQSVQAFFATRSRAVRVCSSLFVLIQSKILTHSRVQIYDLSLLPELAPVFLPRSNSVRAF